MIKVLIGGSPCTHWSAANKFREKESEGLGWELFKNYLIAKERFEPNFFLYENNKSMASAIKEQITEELGVEPIIIDSSLVSAQKRNRLYWTDIPNVKQPEDRKILLEDITLNDVDPIALHNIYGGYHEEVVRVSENKSPTIRTSAGGGHLPYFVKKDLIHNKKAIDYMDRCVADGRSHWDFCHHSDIKNEKSQTVVANFFKGVPYNVFKDWDCIRKFHPIECERLQTLPDNYTEGISDTQRYKCIGNGWTAEVIMHILRHANIPIEEEVVILSMYDGIGTGRYCFDKLGYKKIKYYAFEIDKYAIQIANKNYDDIVELGDAFQIRNDEFELKSIIGI